MASMSELLTESVKQSMLESTKPSVDVVEHVKANYLYQAKNGNWVIESKKHGLKVAFKFEKKKEAVAYSNQVKRWIAYNTPRGSWVIPSKEYRGMHVKKEPKAMMRTSGKHYIVSNGEYSLAFPKHSKSLAEDTLAKMNAGEKVSLSYFERGFYKNTPPCSELRLLKALHGSMDAPKNYSGEKYITHDKCSLHGEYGVIIKCGKEVLLDKRFYHLRDAKTCRDNALPDLIDLLESRLNKQLGIGV